jgi:hypothetical protein
MREKLALANRIFIRGTAGAEQRVLIDKFSDLSGLSLSLYYVFFSCLCVLLRLNISFLGLFASFVVRCLILFAAFSGPELCLGQLNL